MGQKQWVRITAVFFVWMIVLTIFSRAAASVTKAKVTVTKAASQTITHEVKLAGTIEARERFLQYVPAGLMIKSVKISPGQYVKAGDVLFTIDAQKLEEKILETEAGFANAKQKDDTSVSRAEKSWRDVESNAEEEKALAYNTYLKAAAAYNEYISRPKPDEPAEKLDSIKTEGAVSDDSPADSPSASSNDESTAAELKNAMDAAQSAYEAVVREQNRLIKAAADSFQQTKEDIALEQDSRNQEDELEELRTYLQNGGQYLAEYTGVADKVFVEPGTETTAGVAALIADSSEGVRLTASFSEEDRDNITETSTITLRGENMAGSEESYTASGAAISKNTDPNPDGLYEYSLAVDIPGSLYPVGSSVSVTVCSKSEEYNTCVPLRCLRQNGNFQYFIYVTEEQNTVLGKELAAKEMIVTVVDKNEEYAAVEETISGEQQIIESTSKDITDGSRVKIIE